MSHFYFPAYDIALLAHPDPTKPPVRYDNGPINLDLVLTFLPCKDFYGFTGDDMSTQRKPFPAIRFDLPGHLSRCWFYEDERSRDAELRALTNHLVNRGS
jgi:hypothetical protein